MPVAARDEDVSGAIVRNSVESSFEAGRHSDKQITLVRIEAVAHESAVLRPPGVTEFCIEIVRDEISDFVLEALLLLVRERQVVRVRTDFELASLRGGGCA